MTVEEKKPGTMAVTDSIETASSGPTIVFLRNQFVWLALVGASLALASVIYHPAMRVWWEVWWEDDSLYSHGVLVPLISGFIVYLDRERLSKIIIRPNTILGIATLAFVALISFACRAIGSPAMEGFTFPLFLIGGTLLLMGTQMTRALLFPTLFLLFMCPLPDSVLTNINVKIQLLSTVVATKTLLLMQFDAARNGTLIMMPNISVTVGAPCSGFRMLVSLFAFSTFFAYMKEGPLVGRISTVLSAIPLSIVTNSVRVVLIALAGEFFGEKVMHTFHDWSGYIMLVVSFVVLEFISRLLGCRRFRSMQ